MKTMLAAHAAKLMVHPCILHADDLPKFAGSMDDALEILLAETGIDGLSLIFPTSWCSGAMRAENAEDPELTQEGATHFGDRGQL